MVPTMVACTLEMMTKWDAELKTMEEIDVHEAFRALTADIIAHCAFGSSYGEGKQVFRMQYEQQVLFQKDTHTVYIPGSRFDCAFFTFTFSRALLSIIGLTSNALSISQEAKQLKLESSSVPIFFCDQISPNG